MPIIEAGFIDQDGRSNSQLLITNGPTLVVHVGEYDLSESPKNYRSEQALALIDTGASLCMIDKYLAERLSLIQIDKCDISGVGGLKPHPVYMAAVWIPQLELSQAGRFVAGY